MRRLPVSAQRALTRRSLAAGGALWLRPRLKEIRVSAGLRVIAATRANGHLRLDLDDGTAREVDHALLATGYRIDLGLYRFLSPELLRHVRCVDGYPVLDDGLQSSVRGLYFVGATATGSFGPLVRFVSGTAFVAAALTRGVVGAVRGQARPDPRTAGELSPLTESEAHRTAQ